MASRCGSVCRKTATLKPSCGPVTLPVGDRARGSKLTTVLFYQGVVGQLLDAGAEVDAKDDVVTVPDTLF